MPPSELTAGLLTDLEQKIDALCVGGKSKNSLLAEKQIDKRNLDKMIERCKSGQGDVELGTIAEICTKLDIVLEYQGFILGPVIRPSL